MVHTFGACSNIFLWGSWSLLPSEEQEKDFEQRDDTIRTALRKYPLAWDITSLGRGFSNCVFD